MEYNLKNVLATGLKQVFFAKNHHPFQKTWSLKIQSGRETLEFVAQMTK